jgi:hypothetical protein
MKIRDLPENQVSFWYQTYDGEQDIIDSKGRITGDKEKVYSNPVQVKARVSSSTGNLYESPFGSDIAYDKSISTVQKLPIDEYTRLFIDREPVLEQDGSTKTEPDYRVVCVKTGLIQNVWAIKKIRGATDEDQT